MKDARTGADTLRIVSRIEDSALRLGWSAFLFFPAERASACFHTFMRSSIRFRETDMAARDVWECGGAAEVIATPRPIDCRQMRLAD